MNNADNFAVIINDGKISEAGFVELIESEWAEDFFVINKHEFVFGGHEVFDFALVKIHNSSNAAAVFGIENILRSAF